MARRTVAQKRGSVRGAPPGVYLGFSSCDNDNDEQILEVIDWTKNMLLAGVWFVITIAFCVLYVACTDTSE